MVRVYRQWTLAGQEEAAEAISDIRTLRKVMPLLSLIPSLPQPVVMAALADDAAPRPAPSARRRLDATDARSALGAEPKAPKPPISRLGGIA